IFTPEIRLMTIRTCSRSAACAEGSTAPITSAVAIARVRIARVITDPFLEGQPAGLPRWRSRSVSANRRPRAFPISRCETHAGKMFKTQTLIVVARTRAGAAHEPSPIVAEVQDMPPDGQADRRNSPAVVEFRCRKIFAVDGRPRGG